MILTVTFNPCIDKSTSVDRLAPEEKLKCAKPTFEPGGGGVNVARAIKRLGGDAVAIYPSGGYSGKFLDMLIQKENIDSLTVETKKHTRENLIVFETSSNNQYRFGMPGQEMEKEEWEKCLQLIDEHGSEYIVVSGSLTPGIPDDIIAQIASSAKRKNRKVIVDSSGEALRLAIEEGVFLCKPNLHELSMLMNKERLNENEMEKAAMDLVDKGKCEIVVVSMGAKGALLMSKNESYRAKAPDVKIKSTVGVGDSMVAGIVYSLSRGMNLKETLQYGIACGTAATLNPGTQLSHLDDVKQLLQLIDVKEVKLLP
jgi:6-phosphofructokinase 2